MNLRYTRRDFLSLLGQGATFVLLSSCGRTQQAVYAPPPSSQLSPPQPQSPTAAKAPCVVRTPPQYTPDGCFIHEVAPMETVPRLAQTYGVSEEAIYKANKLKRGQELCPGSNILIPHPTQYKNIVPVFRNDAWKYIIVHHTAGEYGKAILVDKMHRERGFEEGLGYHFLIDNGTLGKGNGQLEIAPRWIKQEQGAHCKAGGMNYVGIGIGLVGNFNNEPPSKAQMLTLVKLVDTLRKYYRIPSSHVIGHRDAPGAQTDCPGKQFPWENFKLSLAEASKSGDPDPAAQKGSHSRKKSRSY